MNNEHHIFPVNDIKPHSLLSNFCTCKPSVEHDGFNKLVIHNAFDAREFFEEENLEKELNAKKGH